MVDHSSGESPDDTFQDEPELFRGLDPASYTARRLRHASPRHLHLTSRRCFLGPVPDDWVHSYRKFWYRSRLDLKNYTAKKTTFSPKTFSFERAQEHAFFDGGTDTPGPSPERATDGIPGSESENETSSRTPTAQHASTVRLSDDGNASNDDVTIRGASQQSANITVASSSFFTARESLSYEEPAANLSPTHYSVRSPPARADDADPNMTSMESTDPRASRVSTPADSALEAESTTSLLRSEDSKKDKGKLSAPYFKPLSSQEPRPHDNLEETGVGSSDNAGGRGRLARFNLEDNAFNQQQRIRSRISRTQGKISAHRPRWSQESEGEMVRAQKMLVRVELAPGEIPPDYSENESLRMESKEIAKWREYVVVCRKAADEHAPFTLKMYKSRVIQDVEKHSSSAYYEIPLDPKRTGVNLYSSLDKTVVIWHPEKRGTRIYIVKPRSSAHAVEWYTFVRHALGWHRPTSLLISVPNLGISLIYKDPFDQARPGSEGAKNNKPIKGSEERIAAAAIVKGCMSMLRERKEWAQVLERWSKTAKMGLAWKRFDRLEWIHGANEGQMYGTIAMQTSHDLELRPKHHYPTCVRSSGEVKDEPAPVEGFLVRLTSQSGKQQRLGKKFYKRQYFHTQDRFLCFCKQSRALPPYPSIEEIENDSMPSKPQGFSVDQFEPYSAQENTISWLDNGNEEFIRRQDEAAFAHFTRTIHNLTNTEGFLDLCQVQSIRPLSSGQAAQSNRQNNQNRDCIFEITLNNGLAVHFEAQNKECRDEWVKRLEALREYWMTRTKADADELRGVRIHNLRILDIDERTESVLGQYASKWEVKRAEASPHLYNMCHITGCRSIKMSGQLYRKPRRRSTFHRCQVILTSGQLLIFQDTLRYRTGVEIPHIHKERVATFDLRDCYIYSGILTETDLLYANQTFDNHYPGHHALPRIYLSQDGWTSRDEDTAICFVIWCPTRKSLFRASEIHDGKRSRMLRQVSTLGVPGRSVVFKARSRIERDRWVLGISSEIDRLQEEHGEDMRIV